jgi:hypothetical protein
MKNKPTSISLTQDSFKSAWEGVTSCLNKDDFTKAFERSQERFEKCLLIVREYVEKSYKIRFFVKLTVFVLFGLCDVFWISPRTCPYQYLGGSILPV